MARRVRVYLFGVTLGCVMSYFFLKRGEHDFSFWLPDNRVLTEISDSVTYSPAAICFLECYSIDKKSILKILTDGDVNFSASSPKTTPKIYQIEGNSISEKPLYFRVKMLPKKAEIIEINLINSSKECDC